MWQLSNLCFCLLVAAQIFANDTSFEQDLPSIFSQQNYVVIKHIRLYIKKEEAKVFENWKDQISKINNEDDLINFTRQETDLAVKLQKFALKSQFLSLFRNSFKSMIKRAAKNDTDLDDSYYYFLVGLKDISKNFALELRFIFLELSRPVLAKFGMQVAQEYMLSIFILRIISPIMFDSKFSTGTNKWHLLSMWSELLFKYAINKIRSKNEAIEAILRNKTPRAKISKNLFKEFFREIHFENSILIRKKINLLVEPLFYAGRKLDSKRKSSCITKEFIREYLKDQFSLRDQDADWLAKFIIEKKFGYIGDIKSPVKKKKHRRMWSSSAKKGSSAKKKRRRSAGRYKKNRKPVTARKSSMLCMSQDAVNN